MLYKYYGKDFFLVKQTSGKLKKKLDNVNNENAFMVKLYQKRFQTKQYIKLWCNNYSLFIL